MYEENTENQIPEAKRAIYSRAVIVGFCLFLGPIYGAALLYKNLVDFGNRQMARMALLLTILYMLFVVLFLVRILPFFVASIVSNLIWGAVLAEGFQRRLIPEENELPKKPFLRPLAISLMISSLIMLLSLGILGGDLNQIIK